MSTRPATMHGVEGTLIADPGTGQRWKYQSFSAGKHVTYQGRKCSIVIKVRFDDECSNGHNSFSITGDIDALTGQHRDMGGGSIHDEIAKFFPSLKHLIKWHGVCTDGPYGYLSNTLYHAGDRDHWGLRKGEKRQLKNGRTGQPVWSLRADATGCVMKHQLKDGEDISNLPLYMAQDMLDSEEQPDKVPQLFWEPSWIHGEGKARQLDSARNTAVWPEATDEQLMLPKDELAKLLKARLPALIDAFRADMEAAGLAWESTAEEVSA